MNCMYRMHQRGVVQGVVGSFLLGLAGLVAIPATAGVVFKITFDNADVQTPAPDPYVPGTGEISFPGYNERWGRNTAPETNGNAIVATPDGWQGGRGLRVLGGGWYTYSSGYRCRDTGGNPQLSLNTAGKGFTMEVLALFSNKTGNVLYSGWNVYPLLSVVQGTGASMQLRFNQHSPTTELTSPSVTLADGKFHHVAAVFTFGGTGGQTTIKLYRDGREVASTNYTASAAYVNMGDSAIGIGQYEWPFSMTGIIDAAALSDTPLEPTAFVLPTSAPVKGTVVLVR
jgi:hypothetical protein